MPRSENRSFQAVVKAARQDLAGDTDAMTAAAGRQRVLEGFNARPRRRIWLVSLTTMGLATAAAGLLLWMRLVGNAEGLAFSVDGITVPTGQYIQARPDAEARIAFSDGSEVFLQAGARGRIATVTSEGAAVALEEGAARLQITHRPKSQWQLDAGPFRVHVTGTIFDVKWSSSRQEIEVRLYQGNVVVHGPMTGGGTLLMPGQKLVANAAQATLQVLQIEALMPVEKMSENLPANNAPAEAPTEVATSAPHRRQMSPPHALEPLSWTKLVAAGRYGEVLAGARNRGLQECLRQCPAADVGALADAARYAGNSDLAARALQMQRRRFPASSEARSAAFLLGRMAEEQAAGSEQALRWYDVYLREAAQGPLAPEALGRKMVVFNMRHGSTRTEPIARLYLEKYATGPYADLARKLLQGRGN